MKDTMEYKSLSEYLEALGVDEIEDDYKFVEEEGRAILRYCKDRQFILSDEDYNEAFCRRMDESYYDDWKYEFEKDLGVSDDPWYEEAWYDEDLIEAMRDEEIPVTAANLAAFRAGVAKIFDDKSERNAMLRLVARRMFSWRED